MEEDVVTENGVYYAVPNPDGQGHTVYRRPRSPLTSAPLPDDFDAITQTQDLATERGNMFSRNSWVPTSDPLDTDFDAATFTSTAARTPHPIYQRKQRERRRDAEDDDEDVEEAESAVDRHRFRETGYLTGGSASEAYYGMQSRIPPEREFGRYAHEFDIVPSKKQEVEVTERKEKILPPRRAEKTKERGRGGDDLNRTRDLEIVKNKILEDGPERTVTISSWREKVAEESMEEQPVQMSVYYVSADEYAQEVEQEENISQLDDRLHCLDEDLRRGLSIRSKDTYRQTRDLSPSPSRNSLLLYPNQRLSSDLTRSKSSASSSLPRRLTPPRSSPLSGNSGSGSNTNFTRSKQLPSPPRTSTPNWTGGSSSLPRVSTPARRESISHTTNRIRSRSPAQQRESNSLLPSTIITSIHSKPRTHSPSKSSNNETLRAILSSCQPSLLHILPVLESLGMTRAEHLRAVARLSEETRDREVRDVAYKKGVTVVEWAILLDRILYWD